LKRRKVSSDASNIGVWEVPNPRTILAILVLRLFGKVAISD
jgi:hypothetical protein